MRYLEVALLAGLMLGCRKPVTPAPAAPPLVAKPLAAAAERPSTREACDACRGQWGIHGVAGIESCVCRTSDAGRPCVDGKECQGECLVEPDDFVVVEKGPPPKGFFRGRCSEFDPTFGCHRLILAGARDKGPRLAEDAADEICID